MEKRLPPTFVRGFHDESKVQQMEYRRLGQTDMQTSALGFGGSAFGGVFGHDDPAEFKAVLEEGLRSGINIIDTAPWYGQGKSENMLGKLLQGIPRQSYYLTTKVGRYDPDPNLMFDFSTNRVLQSVEESLARLGLGYVDIIQIHDVEFAPSIDVLVTETLPALQRVVEEGKARFIGVTGYVLDTLRLVVENSATHVDTVLSYCRRLPSDNSLAEFTAFTRVRGLGLMNAACLGMGLFTTHGPEPWHPAPTELKKLYVEAVAYCTARGISPQRLGVHYSLALTDSATCFVSMPTILQLRENLAVAMEGLTEDEQHCLDYILHTYFPVNQNWEGIEVGRYWKSVGGRDVILKKLYSTVQQSKL